MSESSIFELGALPPTISCHSLYAIDNDEHGIQLTHDSLGTLGELWVKPSSTRAPRVKAKLATAHSSTLTGQRRTVFNQLSRQLREHFANTQNALQALPADTTPYLPLDIDVRQLRCNTCGELLGRFVLMPSASTTDKLREMQITLHAITSTWSLPTWLVGGQAAHRGESLPVAMTHSNQPPVPVSIDALIRMIAAKQRDHCR